MAIRLTSQDQLLGRGRYLKKEVERALNLETDLFSKTHEYKGKAGMGNGSWVVKKKAKKDDLKAWLKIKKENEKYY